MFHFAHIYHFNGEILGKSKSDTDWLEIVCQGKGNFVREKSGNLNLLVG